MTNTKLATIALVSLMISGIGPASANLGSALPDTAYFTVNLNHCTPMAPLSGTRPVPTGDAAVVYNEVLIGAYGGNCDAFYAREVKPRLFLSQEES
ncbi:MAG: hypothetical protein ABIY37_03980 [Devosia sp.]